MVGRVSPSPCAWLSAGLDAAVQGYPFEEWGLAGTELLRLSEGALEALGVWRVGHQELLLEAVEQLRALVSNGAMGGGVWDGWRGHTETVWAGWKVDIRLLWAAGRGDVGMLWD